MPISLGLRAEVIDFQRYSESKDKDQQNGWSFHFADFQSITTFKFDYSIVFKVGIIILMILFDLLA